MAHLMDNEWFNRYHSGNFRTPFPPDLGSDPVLWSEDDVVIFFNWCMMEFGTPLLHIYFYPMNGRMLSLMTKSDFNQRSPAYGDILYATFQIFMNKRWVPPRSPRQDLQGLNCCTKTETRLSNTSFRQGEKPQTTHLELSFQVGEAGPSFPRTFRDIELSARTSALYRTRMSPYIYSRKLKPFGRNRLLWEFLLYLLGEPQTFESYIKWLDRDSGVFKILNPQGLAELWGREKNHPTMTYDKLARALRYYYRGKILLKIDGERYCYQFLSNPRDPTMFKRQKHRFLEGS